MEPGNPDVINQLPATGNPMEPQSGTYGNVADTERLKQQLDLPGTGPGNAAVKPTAPHPPGQPQGTQITSPSGGVPDVLLKPTNRPDVPASTPLQGTEPPPSQTVQNHIAALQALISSPTTSQTTKSWAETVLARYRS
jgi:hypothetical protein